jgi:hypothetical protein
MELSPFLSYAPQEDDEMMDPLSIGVGMLPFSKSQDFMNCDVHMGGIGSSHENLHEEKYICEVESAYKGTGVSDLDMNDLPLFSDDHAMVFTSRDSSCKGSSFLSIEEITERGLYYFIYNGLLVDWKSMWYNENEKEERMEERVVDVGGKIRFEVESFSRTLSTEVDCGQFLEGIDGLFWNSKIGIGEDKGCYIYLKTDICDRSVLAELIKFSSHNMLGRRDEEKGVVLDNSLALLLLAYELGHIRLLNHLLSSTIVVSSGMEILSFATIVGLYSDVVATDSKRVIDIAKVIHNFDAFNFVKEYCNHNIEISCRCIPLCAIALIIKSNDNMLKSVYSIYLLEVWVHENFTLLSQPCNNIDVELIAILETITVPYPHWACFFIHMPSNTKLLCKNMWGDWGFLLSQYIYSRSEISMQGITMFPDGSMYHICDFPVDAVILGSLQVLLVAHAGYAVMQTSNGTAILQLQGSKAGTRVVMKVPTISKLLQVTFIQH